MTTVHILRAFTDETGKFGDLAGVILDDGRQLSDARRLAIARQLGFGETVFVNDSELPDVSLFDLQKEIKFAGVPMVCASWLLSKLRGEVISSLHCSVGEVRTWQVGDLVWLRTGLANMPAWNHVQLKNA